MAPEITPTNMDVLALRTASFSSPSPKARATKAPVAMDMPKPKDDVKNKMAPAYPTAAAKDALPNMEIKIISTTSTIKMAIKPMDAVKDITVMCLSKLPSKNFACSAMGYPLDLMFCSSGKSRPMSGPWLWPVKALRKGMNKPFPLRPVSAFTAPVQTPQVLSSNGPSGSMAMA